MITLSVENLIQNHLIQIFSVLSLIFLVFLAWNVALQIQISRIKKRSQEFFAGKKVSNLEDLLLAQAKNLKMLDKDIQELYTISNQINALSFRSYHKLGVVRFNPFKDVGGDQSFSVALLNGKNDGLTISSLFTREGARIYTKVVTAGLSENHPLTEEEKEAIKIATSQEKIKKSIKP